MSKKIMALGKSRKSLADNLYFGQRGMGGIPAPGTQKQGSIKRQPESVAHKIEQEKNNDSDTYYVLRNAFKKKRS